MTIKIGDEVLFVRADGAICCDTVRDTFIYEACLEPYARNTKHDALILTEHSWCYVSDVVGVLPPKERP